MSLIELEKNCTNSFILSSILSDILSSKIDVPFIDKLMEKSKIIPVVFQHLSLAELGRFLEATEDVTSSLISSSFFMEPWYEPSDDSSFKLKDLINQEIKSRIQKLV